jgi:hypothetical protein
MREETPTVLSGTELSNSFLPNAVQLCVVTRDWRRTLEGFVRLGIGPWRIYHCPGDDPSILRDTEYHGRPATYGMTICLGSSGNMTWEVIEPGEGPTIYRDFLEKQGEGIHHVGLSGGDLDYGQVRLQFEERGFQSVQSGTLWNHFRFDYIGTEEATGVTFEIWHPPPSNAPGMPAPDEWYPAPPPKP